MSPRTNSISPSGHGSFYELYGIAAAVLGGCSLRGGEGSIVGILVGTALLQYHGRVGGPFAYCADPTSGYTVG